MSEIVGDYKNYKGIQIFQPKSTFTLKGFEFEFKKWGTEKVKISDDKLLFTLWITEPSPYHPAVMGKIDVYEEINFVYVNPFFKGEAKEKIELQLKKAAGEQLLSHP